MGVLFNLQEHGQICGIYGPCPLFFAKTRGMNHFDSSFCCCGREEVLSISLVSIILLWLGSVGRIAREERRMTIPNILKSPPLTLFLPLPNFFVNSSMVV